MPALPTTPLIENHVKVYLERTPGERTWTVSAVTLDEYPLDGLDDGDYIDGDGDEPGDLNEVDLPNATQLLAALCEAVAEHQPTASLAEPQA